jgi:hypothetical protein
LSPVLPFQLRVLCACKLYSSRDYLYGSNLYGGGLYGSSYMRMLLVDDIVVSIPRIRIAATATGVITALLHIDGDKIYLVNPNYLQTKINALMTIPGEIGFTVRMGLFTGLREEELYYIHDRETCYNELGCKCNNLHPINIDGNTGITIIGINWRRSR